MNSKHNGRASGSNQGQPRGEPAKPAPGMGDERGLDDELKANAGSPKGAASVAPPPLTSGYVGPDRMASGSAGSDWIAGENVGPDRMAGGFEDSDRMTDGDVGSWQMAGGGAGSDRVAGGGVGSDLMAFGDAGSNRTAGGDVGADWMGGGDIGADGMPGEETGSDCMSAGHVGPQRTTVGGVSPVPAYCAEASSDWMAGGTIGSDGMASRDIDRHSFAGPGAEAAQAPATNAAPKSDHAKAARSDAAPKRPYGRAPSAAVATLEPLPLSRELDMFPAFMSRSALFSAIRANSGGSHAGPVPASGKVSLSAWGPRLSMADKRVWEALVRLAKKGGFNVAAPFCAPMGDIAEMAGFGRGQTRSAWAAIERLAALSIDALVDGVAVSGKLLGAARKEGRRRVVAFDARLMRSALGGVLNVDLGSSPRGRSEPPLAQWLGDYFLTHEPSAMDPNLGYLRDLCGYAGAPKEFAAALEAAMASLAAWRPDVIAGWSIDKSKRSSLAWTLSTQRGPARPRVKHPAKPKAPPTATPERLIAAAAAARRRGPAL